MREIYAVNRRMPQKSNKKLLKFCIFVVALLVIAGLSYKLFGPTAVEKAVNQLQFDSSITEAEKQTIRGALLKQSITFDGRINVAVKTSLSTEKTSAVLSVYVPVTNKYSSRQKITKAELGGTSIKVPAEVGENVRTSMAEMLGLSASKLVAFSGSLEKISDTTVAFIPVSQLSAKVKLLAYEGAYYLDSFKKGAIFRNAEFTGGSAVSLDNLRLNTLATKDKTLKVNMTGVTALTRVMMRKLSSVDDPTYFSAKIGKFLADADITHTSNEVSFKKGCTFSNAVFCAPSEMIETLKDSGVDLVELTGNHNNDVGNQYNTSSIKLYQSLGWNTFGGGLNVAEASKPFIAAKKQSKIAFLGYNYPDSPSGGAIAKTSTAGANSFDFEKIKTDIASAKQQAGFVIVDIQFWECYSYPDGYIEMPECDLPIGSQKDVFRKIADLGADMVIGTQAHQPQTYEVYKGKPIYYGLGNLYFEQTQWPGTERGIILSHYFVDSKLLQTKLSLTVYDESLQTRLMNNTGAVYLLERLKTARINAGL